MPLCATAAAHAGFLGWIAPVEVSPSFQHRYVRLPGTIIAPCADAGAAVNTDPNTAAAAPSAPPASTARRR
ncbi:hypothetical protein GCM10022214_69580 [Actinomadura miaoliensis]|uniref:Uncharacterized protein n=1 Tax=Actinomadura miaoliensis TaxID=430685 RepID=A0ABP7WT36_9ACTN